MNTQINHALMSIEICIENDQSGSGYVPDQQMALRYHKKKWDQCTIKSTKTHHVHHQTEIKTGGKTGFLKFI